MDNESIKEIAALAKASEAIVVSVEAQIPGDPDLQFLVTANGDGGTDVLSLQAAQLENRSVPRVIRGTAHVGTIGSFVDLVNRHKDMDSVVFGQFGDKPALLAVIDYNKIDHSPRFGRHRIAYAFPISQEWAAWSAMNGKVMSQGEWASFVEDRISELSAPMEAERSEYERLFQSKIALPSELVQLSRGMQVSVEARIKDVRTLQSGESEIVYEEVHKDGKGERLIVPGLFVIQIPLFVGGEPVRILARLRYRKQDARIVWFYQLYRADEVVRDRLEADLAFVAGETGLPAFEGEPEK